MIGQYLSNTNESATVPVLQKILELNKSQGKQKGAFTGTCKEARRPCPCSAPVLAVLGSRVEVGIGPCRCGTQHGPHVFHVVLRAM